MSRAAMLTRADCAELLAMARRQARGRIEADDLMQDALVAALGSGGRVAMADRARLAGVMRNLARMNARSAARRLRRETVSAMMPRDMTSDDDGGATTLDGLAPGLRIVAALALSGHIRAEIRYLLGISDEVLRQRIAGIKRHFTARGEPLPTGIPGLRGALAFGAIRRGLIPLVRRLNTGLATHDPDGHLVAFGNMRMPAHKTRPGGNRQS